MNIMWEKTKPNGYMKRDIPCTEYKVDDCHTVLILLRNDCYDSYVMEKNPGEPLGTPFLYMFGTPVSEMDYDDIVDMTIRVAPEYYNLFNV